MEKECKRPVVYVPRKLEVDGIDELYPVICWFVSKAYLKMTTIEYPEHDNKYVAHVVDYSINPDMLEQNCELSANIEDGDNVLKAIVFKDYKSCKEYVNQLNKLRFKNLIKGKHECACEEIEDKFKQVLKCGKDLEDKCIPFQERQQISESANNI
ncbi:MAG: hypothetical protein ACLRFE_00740 [Clostridia bacterium]